MSWDLRAKAEYEVRHPRPSVVAAVEELGLVSGMTVLDAGCGYGAHLPLFARHVGPNGYVTGLDIDEERLAVAAELCADFIEEGWIRLQPGDIAALPFADGTFDLAWSSLVLHHFQDMTGLVGELARVVIAGGMVAVLEGDHNGSFPLLPWPPAFEQRLRDAILRGEQEAYGGQLPDVSAGYVGRSLPKLLHAAGLTDVRVQAFSDVYHAPLSAEREAELRDWLLSWLNRRARDWLDPRDWEQVVSYLGPGSSDYLLAGPDFFVSRTWFLAMGRVSDIE